MATPVDPQTPEASGQKKGHVRFIEVSSCDEDQGSAQDHREPVWSAALFVSKMNSAHHREINTQLYPDTPEYREVLRDQELQLRTTVPLPMGAAMDEETLRILLDVKKIYRRHLGADHAVTADARRRIQMLRDRTSAQGVREEPKTSVWSRWRSVLSRRRSAERHTQIQNNP